VEQPGPSRTEHDGNNRGHHGNNQAVACRLEKRAVAPQLPIPVERKTLPDNRQPGSVERLGYDYENRKVEEKQDGERPKSDQPIPRPQSKGGAKG